VPLLVVHARHADFFAEQSWDHGFQAEEQLALNSGAGSCLSSKAVAKPQAA
jgi:hypothetical protein